MSDFDIQKMFDDSFKALKGFAQNHPNETFYAFTIDVNMLCLNSVEAFEETLERYKLAYPQHYDKIKEINDLKYNCADWEYFGFFDLEEGYDDKLYDEYYHIPFNNMGSSEDEINEMFGKTPYYLAMNSLLQKLIDSKVFDLLNKTFDFKAFLSKHNY